MNQITDLNDLRLFVEVVDHGSFSAASRGLRMQTSTLSRRIRALEDELQVRLLNRTSRSLSLTEVGRQFYQYCVALVAQSKAARDIVEQTRTKPQGTVRISCPVALLGSGVSAIISQYIADTPQVQVHIDATNRRVDVVEEGLDFALRVRVPPLETSDLVVRELGKSVRILVASPELTARYADATSLESLMDCATLALATGNERFVWSLLDADGRTVAWKHHPRMVTDDMASLRVAAIHGVGVALLPRELVNADIRAGLLRHLLPGMTPTPGIVQAIFPSRRGMVPAVRDLLDALVVGFEHLTGEWSNFE
jgi:DNA-binding transcriptional LysR family regulator